ncbi:hypothetical protein FB45DRAFT_911481, partial [Roridomyces roridus]
LALDTYCIALHRLQLLANTAIDSFAQIGSSRPGPMYFVPRSPLLCAFYLSRSTGDDSTNAVVPNPLRTIHASASGRENARRLFAHVRGSWCSERACKQHPCRVVLSGEHYFPAAVDWTPPRWAMIILQASVVDQVVLSVVLGRSVPSLIHHHHCDFRHLDASVYT